MGTPVTNYVISVKPDLSKANRAGSWIARQGLGSSLKCGKKVGMAKSLFVFILSMIALLATEREAFAQTSDSDVVIILDTSGSMSDRHTYNGEDMTKLDAAKRRLKTTVESLASSGKVNLALITFRDAQAFLERELSPLTDPKALVEKINGLSPNGGTPLAKSILYAKDLFLSGKGKYRSLIIISDGQDDQGRTAVTSAIREFNLATNANVQIQMFAMAASPSLWTEFKTLSDVIIFGTLYLWASGDDASSLDPLFNLTYDSITGQWPQSQFFDRLKKNLENLPRLHAERVHIINSSASKTYAVPSIWRQVGVDWEMMKRSNPKLYDNYKNRIELVESNYLKLKAQMSALYWTSFSLQRQTNGGPSAITVYSAAAVEQYDELKQLFKDRPWMATAVSSQSVLGIASMSPVFIIDASLNAVSSMTGSPRFMLMDSINRRGTGETLSAGVGGGLGIIFGLMTAAEGGKSALSSGGLMMGAGSLFFSTSSAMISLESADDRLRKREQEELHVHNDFLSIERGRQELKILFPQLSDAQLRSKVERMRANGLSEKQRLEILFDHDPSLKPLVSALIEVQKLVDKVATERIPKSSLELLRGQEELPSAIEAHLEKLGENLAAGVKVLRQVHEQSVSAKLISPAISEFVLLRIASVDRGVDEFNADVKTLSSEFK